MEVEDEEEDVVDKIMFTEEENLDLKFFRLENLMLRRPFLLSNTLLRQNPNDVF